MKKNVLTPIDIMEMISHIEHDCCILNKYGKNLTRLAFSDSLPPCFGREKEVERIAISLSRRMKSNVILTGQSGVGKTAVVEELARYFIESAKSTGELKIIYELPLNNIISGSKYRGDFEEKLKGILDEVINKPVIIFIDEIHCIVDAGAAEGAISGAEILKPALARGEICCIGATTTDEYEIIKSNKALARRFNNIEIEKLSGEKAYNCINGILIDYGNYFNINTDKVDRDNLYKASEKVLTKTAFPDNIIDIIDGALAKAKHENKKFITDKDIIEKIFEDYGILWISE